MNPFSAMYRLTANRVVHAFREGCPAENPMSVPLGQRKPVGRGHLCE